MKIKEVIHHLEKRFPLYWQEDFDNCGIQCGDKEQEITAALVCFDFSEEVINEALALNANLIVSHHPLMLRNGIKKIEPTNRVGKIICKALENKLVLYSMHTNIDSGIGGGNTLFANKLGLKNVKVLAPKEALFQKLVVYVPTGNSVALKDALFAAGCGTFGNYKNCSFSVEGTGTFEPLKGAKPYIGQINNTEVVEEERVEMIFPTLLQRKVIDTLYKFHPYEEPAFDIFKLENSCREIGLGRIGKLEHPLGNDDFFTFLKEKLSLKIIKYSGKINRKIETVALCGGGG
ncbi:MAG: Nif3-like dinuclear metal center hexameric protein, partial [Bacteroidales bacterium]